MVERKPTSDRMLAAEVATVLGLLKGNPPANVLSELDKLYRKITAAMASRDSSCHVTRERAHAAYQIFQLRETLSRSSHDHAAEMHWQAAVMAADEWCRNGALGI